MVNELLMYDYMITLIEAAKKSTKKLKRKKIKRILEDEYERERYRELENDIKELMSLLRNYETKLADIKDLKYQVGAISAYLGKEKVLKGWLIGIKEIVGKAGYGALKEVLIDFTEFADDVIKPKNLYLLKPAIDAMRAYLNKCKEITGRSGNTGNKLLESDKKEIEVTEKDCNAIIPLFHNFITRYESMEKDTPFYKKWYAWYLTLPKWKQILIAIALLIVLLVILLLIFKVGPKVVGAIKRALKGDKTVGKQLVIAASRVDSNTKAAAFKVGFEPLTKSAALYL